jgi:hypothetical protein
MKVRAVISYASCNLKLIGAFKHTKKEGRVGWEEESQECAGFRANTIGAFGASTAWTSESLVRVPTTP